MANRYKIWLNLTWIVLWKWAPPGILSVSRSKDCPTSGKPHFVCALSILSMRAVGLLVTFLFYQLSFSVLLWIGLAKHTSSAEIMNWCDNEMKTKPCRMVSPMRVSGAVRWLNITWKHITKQRFWNMWMVESKMILDILHNNSWIVSMDKNSNVKMVIIFTLLQHYQIKQFWLV